MKHMNLVYGQEFKELQNRAKNRYNAKDLGYSKRLNKKYYVITP